MKPCSQNTNDSDPKSIAVSWIILAVACAAQFMVVLDVSVVNVALPSIQADLGFTSANLQWVVNAYALTFAGFMLLGGRLADVYGVRKIFLIGLALFSISSLVGGLADAPVTLIIARGFQGLGAAILAPASLTLLTTTFPEGPQRNRALAIWTAVALAGGTAGNVVGGTLTQFLSWHWVLLINVPVGVIAIPLAAAFLPNDRFMNARPKLDILGAILVTFGLATLIYGITLTQILGWTHALTLASLTIAIGVLLSFVWVEAKFTPHPLIPLRLFQRQSIAVGNMTMLLAGAAFMPMWYFLSLYMQKVMHYTPLETGIGFLPHTLVTMIVGIHLTPRLMDYIADRTLVIVGALLASTGFFWQGFVTPESGYVNAILLPGIVFSFGGGLLNTPLTNLVTVGVQKSDLGAASGIMNTAKQVGGVLGLTILVTLAVNLQDSSINIGASYNDAFLAIAVVLLAVAMIAVALPTKVSTPYK